jgi:APA family basic amino acid/polyamine antiporter
VLLTWTNSRGIEYGKIVQNIFTTAKVSAIAALILAGVFLGRSAEAIQINFTAPFALGAFDPALGVAAGTVFGLIIAIGVAQSGSLFSADAWHDVTFIGCTAVVLLYLLTNVIYLLVLPMPAIQHAPSDRVATAVLERIFPSYGALLMAIAIMISTFGCVNSLVLSGARAYYAMAKDRLFFVQAGRLNRFQVPAWSLWIQGLWAAALVLPRTYNTATGQYGNLYGNLLDYVISAALIFYILTIAAVFRLRHKMPNVERSYRVPGYPVTPALYILGAAVVLVILFAYRPATTWPGLVIVLAGAIVYACLPRR